MRRILSLALIGGCLATGGCGWLWPDTDVGPQLSVGQQFALRLESNPSTGFAWTITELNTSVLENTGHTWAADPSCGDPPAVGCAGHDTWTFIARSAGTTTLRMEYGQVSAPANTPPANTYEVEVTVTD